jgi:DNA-binding transcriptional LysR family regulator
MRKIDLHKRTFEWSELQTILEISRAGSLAGAARKLGVEHSTVYRRLGAVEARLRSRLFERTRSGYLSLAAAEPLIEAACRMEEAVHAAERATLGAEEHLAGEIRLNVSDALGAYLVPQLLAEFLRTHPAIEIEVALTNRHVDLSRREADLALRLHPRPPDHLIARRIGTVTFSAYAAPNLLRAKPKRLHDLPWLGYEDAIATTPQAAWLREFAPSPSPRSRWGSLIAITQAAAAGLGAAVLTDFIANKTPNLVRITDSLGEVPLFLLSHPDVRGSARVRALSEHIGATAPRLLSELSRPHKPSRLLQAREGG